MIIGLGYKARTGKDAIGDYLVRHWGFRKTAFAESLKEACASIFGLTHEQMYGDQKEVIDKFWGVTPRHILQLVGTECMRKGFHPDVWVKSLEHRMALAEAEKYISPRWVITDVRFQNEVYAIKSWGGKVFRVDREQVNPINGVHKHQSELDLDDFDNWDGIINNNGTLAELHMSVNSLLGKWIDGGESDGNKR